MDSRVSNAVSLLLLSEWTLLIELDLSKTGTAVTVVECQSDETPIADCSEEFSQTFGTFFGNHDLSVKAYESRMIILCMYAYIQNHKYRPVAVRCSFGYFVLCLRVVSSFVLKLSVPIQ